MHAYTEHSDLQDFIAYDAIHRRPLYLRLGLTDNKSDKVWVVWRETKHSPLLTLYGKRGTNLRVGKSWDPLHRVSSIRKKIEEKLKKGYSFEQAFTLNQPSDFGEILGEVREAEFFAKHTILRDEQGRVVVEVPNHVGTVIARMVDGRISKNFA